MGAIEISESLRVQQAYLSLKGNSSLRQSSKEISVMSFRSWEKIL
jgi:hypothetical protein